MATGLPAASNFYINYFILQGLGSVSSMLVAIVGLIVFILLSKLLDSTHSIKDTAYALRFRHPSHFCREFKQRYGMTPSQFVRKRAMARTWIKPLG